VWLYSVVFAGKLSVAAIMLLLLSFFIQPFHQALANEALTEDQTLPEEVEQQLPRSESETTEESLVTDDGGDDTIQAEEPTEETSVFQNEISEETISELGTPDLEPAESAYEAKTTEMVLEDGATTDVNDDISSSTPESSVTADGALNEDSDTEQPEVSTKDEATSGMEPDETTENANEDDLISSEEIETGVNDLVDNVVKEVVTLTRQMVTEENYFQFSKQSCVAVGDGTYHCTTKDKVALDPDSAVYAEQDATGDMEIYMRTSKGDVKQITDNDFDDTSPDMDLASMRVVWQRLIDGRYQIISYDIEEREETQLTFSRTNSMEPKVAKEGVVWQAWDGNDWEIIFFDGKFTDQVTDNEIQDVTPVIEEGYVLWSLLGGEASEARVYSIESGEMMTITGHDGGAVANPRFVLVYDTKFDNGDVVTQGFDPVTGLASPISAQPAELPFDIPEADPVGEIRALIQNKSTQKDKEVITVPVSSGQGDLNLATTSTGSTDVLILNNIQPDVTDAILTPVVDELLNFELTEYDLVITKDASSTNAAINRQYDLIDANITSITSVR
jgi:hypothetical protein